MSASLHAAVSQLVRFLTAKLVAKYPPATLSSLQTALELNLTRHYAASWHPNDPVRGSALRCLTLSPATLPPHPIWSACSSNNVQWFDWIKLLGDTELDLFVDPGCVAIRINAQVFTIWSDAAPAVPTSLLRPSSHPSPRTLAQQLSEHDREEEEQLFHLLNDEIAAPSWSTPSLPIPPRSTSPLSDHSRCSSRSSNSSSSGFSHYSGDTGSSRTSATSASPKSTISATGQYKQSRRERARQARVFVDPTKKLVTPYDGGKTTVLTGGVMLGGAPPKPTSATHNYKPNKMALADNAAISNSNSRRPVRA